MNTKSEPIDISILNQDNIITNLINSIKHDRIHNTYVFSGHPDAGTIDIMNYFSKAVLCKDKNNIPCDICQSCTFYNNNKHPDIRTIEPEKGKKKLSIEQVREIYGFSKFASVHSSHSICQILNCETMSSVVGNSLLKLIEEPPNNYIFLLTVTNYNILLPTIISRSQIIKINNLSQDTISETLTKNFNLNKEESKFLSVICGGKIKQAISYLNSDILKLRKQILSEFIQVLKSNKFLEMFIFSDNLITTGKNKETDEEILQKIRLLSYLLRDILYYRHSKSATNIINIDFTDEIITIAENIPSDFINKTLNNLVNMPNNMERNYNKNLLFANLFNH